MPTRARNPPRRRINRFAAPRPRRRPATAMPRSSAKSKPPAAPRPKTARRARSIVPKEGAAATPVPRAPAAPEAEVKAEPILERILLPYQRAWVADACRFKIGMFSRQTGKSFATACETVTDCILRPGQHWVCLSAGERQALEWMRKARQWTEALQVAVAAYDETVNAADARLSRAEIEFRNGSRITAIPANPDTARGYSANLVLDEFAAHEKPWEIWAAIYPSITSPHGGMKCLRIISTPRGLGNKFADIWLRSQVFSKHRVTIYDAARQGLAIDVEALRAGVGDEDVWRQEYLCEFLDASGVLLPYELIQGCTAEHLADPGDCPLYIGMDIGRSRDLTVIATLAEVAGLLLLVELQELRGRPFAEQFEALGRHLRDPRVRRCCIDATGIGAMLAEEARRRYGSRVEPVFFTQRSKEALFSGLKRTFEDSRIRIPPSRELREDLHGMQKSVSTGGAVRYFALHGPDGHSDRASALALAVRAALRRGQYVPPILPSARRYETRHFFR